MISDRVMPVVRKDIVVRKSYRRTKEMKGNIVAMVIAMSVLMSGIALGAETTNDVYDFGAGTEIITFVPANQSVAFWNEFTGMTLDDGDWLNITYTNITGDSVSDYYYVETADEETFLNISWNETKWVDVMAYPILTENFTTEIYLSVNNDSEELAIPIFPNVDYEYDGLVYSIMAVTDRDFSIGDISMKYVLEYKAGEDIVADTGINWTADDEPAIVFTYDEIEYPLTSYGFYYFEDAEIFVNVGEIAEDETAVTYVIISGYDISDAGTATTETRRYWMQEGASTTARYITGTKNTFTMSAGTDYTVFDVPTDNIARVKIGTGAVRDYSIEMSGDSGYSISRLKRAYGTAESVADLADTTADVVFVEGVYFQRAKTITLSIDDDDILSFEQNGVFIIDNSFDFGVKNWYYAGEKTTDWAVTGFSYF